MQAGIGDTVRRKEDLRLVTGRGCYSDDFNFPDQAYGAAVRSPHAHALISCIDVAAARAMPGVLAVLTGAGCAAPTGSKRSRISPLRARRPTSCSIIATARRCRRRRIRAADRPRASCRHRGRLRDRRDGRASEGCGRKGRRRLRAAAGGDARAAAAGRARRGSTTICRIS